MPRFQSGVITTGPTGAASISILTDPGVRYVLSWSLDATVGTLKVAEDAGGLSYEFETSLGSGEHPEWDLSETYSARIEFIATGEVVVLGITGSDVSTNIGQYRMIRCVNN